MKQKEKDKKLRKGPWLGYYAKAKPQFWYKLGCYDHYYIGFNMTKTP
jgi:hypothetical protein